MSDKMCLRKLMDLQKCLIDALLKAAQKYGNMQRLIEAKNLHQPTISKIVNKGHRPRLDTMNKLFDALGAKVVFPFDSDYTQTVRPVYFVGSQTASSANIGEAVEDNHIAIPLASMPVSAGPGMIPEEKIKSWILVWTGQKAIRHRTNLIAVEVGQGQLSMIPTLHPGDLVLVDRNDRIPHGASGNLFLVREPPADDAGLSIKRVTLKKKNNHDLIIFYSDNKDYTPEIYDLAVDYANDIHQAILGRIVWSWADMTRK